MLSETPTDVMPASVLMLVSPTTPNPVIAFAPIDPTAASAVLPSTYVRITFKQAPSGKSVTFTATVLTESGEKPAGTVIFEVQGLPSKEVELQHGTASTKIKHCLKAGTITVFYSGDTRHASSSEDLVFTPTNVMSDAAPVRSEPTAPAVSAEVVEQGARSSIASLDDLDNATLVDRIEEFWTSDQNDGSILGTRRRRLKESRVRFGEHLAAYQRRLATPGRDGMWASFLRRIHMPKSSASRYIKQWELSVRPKSPVQVTATSGEPSEEDVSALVIKLKSTVKRVLTTEDSVAKFLIAFNDALQPATNV
jgi:hypothetical protein